MCQLLSNLNKSDSSIFDESTELKGLGADFVFGFVQSMDGERDPRNLLLAFQIAKNIIHRGYDLGESMQRLSHWCPFDLLITFL